MTQERPGTTVSADSGRLGRLLAMARWILVVVALVGAVAVVVQLVLGDPLTEADIERFVGRFGVAAPLIFIVVGTVLGSLLVPSTVLMVAGATLFGRLGGFVYSTVAIVVAALLGFLVARTLGRERVSRWLDRRQQGFLNRIERRLVDKGFVTALFMRLLYIPNGLINVVCGVSGMRVSSFAAATFVGTVPLVFAITFIAASAKEAVLGGNWSALASPETVLSALLFLLCLSTPFIAGAVRRRLRARGLIASPLRELNGLFAGEEDDESVGSSAGSPGEPASAGSAGSGAPDTEADGGERSSREE
jgi:uncharacterized membrane protein YdjX (TVP38/TMEM64 family)